MGTFLVKDDLGIKDFGFTSKGHYTSYSFTVDGVYYFISNLIEHTGDKYHDNSSRREMAERLLNLRSNNYKFMKFYGGKFDNPIDFIQWIKTKKLTLEIHGSPFVKSENFTDFHGNLKEVSCAFHFRIYNKDLLSDIETIVSQLKKHYHYKN
jgi:hypothetical protein